jgi:hypothetical protein
MGSEGTASYGAQAPAKSTPRLSETRDKFLTCRGEKGTQTPCAVESAHSSVYSPSPPFGRLGSQRALGSLLKSLLWSFGNSVRQHEAHSTRGSRMTAATSASPRAVMVDFERLDAVSDQRRRDRLPTGGLRVYRKMRLCALQVLWAIGPTAYHTPNASPDRQRLAIVEMTQGA